MEQENHTQKGNRKWQQYGTDERTVESLCPVFFRVWGGLMRSSVRCSLKCERSEGIKRISIKYYTTKFFFRKMELFERLELKGKSQAISMAQVQSAYQKVKSNDGAGGVDGIELSDYEADKVKRLYKLWNRMASGSYHPQAVRAVELPKADGSKRLLGIPTIEDRVAQQVVKDVIEARMEKAFHRDSYGYRPDKGAHEAIGLCRERCCEQPYVIDLDIKGFFDNIDHERMLQVVRHYVQEKWVLMYIERWLKSPLQRKNGTKEPRTKGTPQGGVISPLLANMYLHVVFDAWISRHIAGVKWDRYADDIIIHCTTESQAQAVLQAVKDRLMAVGLQAHEGKTKIVYCPNRRIKIDFPVITFDFLGYCFRPRQCMSKKGKSFMGFTPAISPKAVKSIKASLRAHKFQRLSHLELPQIAAQLEGKLRGWIHYYGKFTPSGLWGVLKEYLNERLGVWVCNKYKSCKGNIKKGMEKLRGIYKDFPNLFVHWQYGYHP
jgi:group II intron reverse transcriptase/maturase